MLLWPAGLCLLFCYYAHLVFVCFFVIMPTWWGRQYLQCSGENNKMEETPLNKASKGNFIEMCSILAAKYNFMHEKKTTHRGDGKISENFVTL